MYAEGNSYGFNGYIHMETEYGIRGGDPPNCILVFIAGSVSRLQIDPPWNEMGWNGGVSKNQKKQNNPPTCEMKGGESVKRKRMDVPCAHPSPVKGRDNALILVMIPEWKMDVAPEWWRAFKDVIQRATETQHKLTESKKLQLLHIWGEVNALTGLQIPG